MAGIVSEMEGAFARAVLDPEAAVPESLSQAEGTVPTRRFAVYRNNVYASLVDLLAARFRVTARLVGEEFFRAMARVYVQEDPPRSPVLLQYGASFSNFIAGFPPAAPVPYLADVARLEWARHVAYHAADAEALSLEALQAALEGVEEATLTLHPSLSVVQSAYPVVTIWQLAMQEGENEPARLPPNGEDVLVTRPRMAVEVRRLPKGSADFVLALQRGANLHDAAVAALAAAPEVDLEANLAGLMVSGVIVGIGGNAYTNPLRSNES
jgi:hypothetical protein